jgi:hypothetical protein
MENSVSTKPVEPVQNQKMCTYEGKGQKIGEQSNVRTGLNLGHADGRIHNLTQEGTGERAHRSFGRAVHATAHIRFPSCDRPDIDDVARVAGLEVFRE